MTLQQFVDLCGSFEDFSVQMEPFGWSVSESSFNRVLLRKGKRRLAVFYQHAGNLGSSYCNGSEYTTSGKFVNLETVFQ